MNKGFLAGTGSELEHGVGGGGEHPSPACVRSDDGALHVAGEPPAGTVAGSDVPEGDSVDLQSGDVSPEALARLQAESEPAQYKVRRVDIGTD